MDNNKEEVEKRIEDLISLCVKKNQGEKAINVIYSAYLYTKLDIKESFEKFYAGRTRDKMQLQVAVLSLYKKSDLCGFLIKALDGEIGRLNKLRSIGTHTALQIQKFFDIEVKSKLKSYDKILILRKELKLIQSTSDTNIAERIQTILNETA